MYGRSIQLKRGVIEGSHCDMSTLMSTEGFSHVDPLDAMINELERIETQQVTLKEAVKQNKPIVVYPRPEVCAGMHEHDITYGVFQLIS
jgi:hypothetical protein